MGIFNTTTDKDKARIAFAVAKHDLLIAMQAYMRAKRDLEVCNLQTSKKRVRRCAHAQQSL